MGGSAFAQASAPGAPTLNTPRMSPEEYERLKCFWTQRLQAYFPDAKIQGLREAPEKESYGDIDMFVVTEQRVDFVAMAQHLGAKGVIIRSGGLVQKCSLAVFRDAYLQSITTIVYKLLDAKDPQPTGTVTTEEYAQIDIEVLEPQLVEWHVFYSSYSDLAGMLGRIVTNLGFSITDRGLWLRMVELDESKKSQHINIADRDGMVFLSRDPNKVMEFLGISANGFTEGFNTLNEMYEWLAKCRLLFAESVKVKRDKSHDRNREQKRTVFAGFFRGWLPAHMDMKPEQGADEHARRIKELRQTFLNDALAFFSKSEEYESKHNPVVLAIDNATAAALLKPIIARHSGKKEKSLNEVVRAFRRYVSINEQGEPSILDQSHSDADSQLHQLLGTDKASLKEFGAVDAWVKSNWEQLRTLERKKGKPEPPSE